MARALFSCRRRGSRSIVPFEISWLVSSSGWLLRVRSRASLDGARGVFFGGSLGAAFVATWLRALAFDFFFMIPSAVGMRGRHSEDSGRRCGMRAAEQESEEHCRQ